ncbi:hypothetical protein P4S72_02030 [Vibrio sp. PP-XX7]
MDDQDEQQTIIALLDQLAPKLQRVVSAPIAIDDIPQTYQTLINSSAPYLKAVICP